MPIVDYNPKMAHAYNGLPIVEVKNWSDVTPAFLERQRDIINEKAAQGYYHLSAAYVPYWLGRIEGEFCL